MSKRNSILASMATAPMTACVALGLFAGSAQAATISHPSASMVFATARVTSGVPAALTYMTAGDPAGSAIYLERASAGHAWQPVARLSAAGGTVRVPSGPAGRYRYRILITGQRKVLAVSAPEALTVTRSHKSAGCAACDVAKAALPWLTPFIQPIADYLVQQAAPVVLAFLSSLLGF